MSGSWSGVPTDLVARIEQRRPDEPHRSSGAQWLANLPGIVGRHLEKWDLQTDGAALSGHNAIALPVRRGEQPLVLKISWPHREADHEHIGLQHWAGRGAVELVAADPAENALLLERLDMDRDLRGVELTQACEIIGDLLRRLHVEPPPSVPGFREVVGSWVEPLRTNPAGIPRRYAQRAIEIFDGLDYRPVLLHLDLHFENVLAAERSPWLAIDPKPTSGPAGFEIYPALRNRVEEYDFSSGLAWEVRHRLETVCDAAGIDIDDARRWSLVHAVLNAYEASQEDQDLSPSTHLAIAKVLAEP